MILDIDVVVSDEVAYSEVERLRAVLHAIAAHADAMVNEAKTNKPHTNSIGFAYITLLATDALER